MALGEPEVEEPVDIAGDGLEVIEVLQDVPDERLLDGSTWGI
ncbi:hypothetical protein [Thermogemmatispora tikiterensis]|nr:hypothetical protein [Thermogemmatispora tikiterensis]